MFNYSKDPNIFKINNIKCGNSSIYNFNICVYNTNKNLTYAKRSCEYDDYEVILGECNKDSFKRSVTFHKKTECSTDNDLSNDGVQCEQLPNNNSATIAFFIISGVVLFGLFISLFYIHHKFRYSALFKSFHRYIILLSMIFSEIILILINSLHITKANCYILQSFNSIFIFIAIQYNIYI